MKQIVAVLILYKIELETSTTFCTLRDARLRDKRISDAVDLLVFDNSPVPHEPPTGFFGRYLHDGANPGLARRYNQALEQATLQGATWLLLLDQDTTLTDAYFDELLRLSEELAPEKSVVAVVPRLLSHGKMRSPHLPRFQTPEAPFDLGQGGLATGLLRAFNSAAVLRVSALDEVGGFPETYWLDYLDHATLHRLQQDSGRLYVMDASLDHDMSIHREDRHRDPAYARRHRNQLAAELRFYQEFGSPRERKRHRINLLVRAVTTLAHANVRECLRLLQASCSRPVQRKTATRGNL